MNYLNNQWKKSNMQAFWGEIAPSNHLVQIYDSRIVFLNSLEGFTGSGFLNNESVVVIATKEHLDELNERLINQGFDLDLFKKNNQYFPIDAEELLSKFMIGDKPDEALFNEHISRVIQKAKRNDRKIRAFGEMVALLWDRGNQKGTLLLEQIWNNFTENEKFCLFCAYPKDKLQDNSMEHVCTAHSKIISGEANSTTEIFYKDVEVTF